MFLRATSSGVGMSDSPFYPASAEKEDETGSFVSWTMSDRYRARVLSLPVQGSAECRPAGLPSVL